MSPFLLINTKFAPMKKFILLLFSLTIISAQKVSLVGTVLDSENKEPLVGANVIIQSDKLNTGSATNFEGLWCTSSTYKCDN